MTRSPTPLEHVARRLFWWLPEQEALKDKRRFLAQVMACGTWQDVVIVRQFFSEAQFLDVLDNPPPGVFDPRSWAYWNLLFHRPQKPLPKGRALPQAE